MKLKYITFNAMLQFDLTAEDVEQIRALGGAADSPGDKQAILNRVDTFDHFIEFSTETPKIISWGFHAHEITLLIKLGEAGSNGFHQRLVQAHRLAYLSTPSPITP